MKRLTTICLAATMIFAFGITGQVLANYDPESIAPAPVLDTGWAYDQIDAAFVDSTDSPYVYNLAAPAYFRITDDFIIGDTYYVYDFGSLILTTTPAYAGAPTGFPDPGESAWQSSSYSGGEVILSVGSHYLTVQGDGAGGLPAGLYTQLTSVPEPTTICLLGLGALSLLRKKHA